MGSAGHEQKDACWSLFATRSGGLVVRHNLADKAKQVGSSPLDYSEGGA